MSSLVALRSNWRPAAAALAGATGAGRSAAARFFEWVKDVGARAAGDAVRKAAGILCTPDYEDFFGEWS